MIPSLSDDAVVRRRTRPDLHRPPPLAAECFLRFAAAEDADPAGDVVRGPFAAVRLVAAGIEGRRRPDGPWEPAAHYFVDRGVHGWRPHGMTGVLTYVNIVLR